MPERVETVARVGDRRVHRFQVLRERREDGSTREWVVVSVDEDGLDLASLDFEWHRRVPLEAVETGDLEPLVAGGVPVWGY